MPASYSTPPASTGSPLEQYLLDHDALSHAVDAVSLAVEAGLKAPGGFRPEASAAAIRESRDLLVQARRDGAFLASLPRALELVCENPASEPIQINAARLITEGADRRQALAVWRALQHRFPDSVEAFRLFVRLVRQFSGDEVAMAAVEERFPGLMMPNLPQELVIFGMALEELGRFEDAEAAFDKVTQADPANRHGWRRLAHLQQRRGSLREAQRTLEAGFAVSGDPAMGKSVATLLRSIQSLESFSEIGELDGSPASVAAINFIVRQLAADRTALDLRPRSSLGSTVFVAGSLGPGGAERQLVITASGFQRAAANCESIDGIDVLGPFHVCCRTLSAKAENDFYRPSMEAVGVSVTSYMSNEPFGGRIKASVALPYAGAIEFLPVRVREGILHLADHLRELAPDIVNIWQDGMIFAGGLAALIAQVPHIVLSVRTLPPSERVNRWKVEMEPLFRALLCAPGVVLTANSVIAGRAYERWLGLPLHSVPVVPNGVDPLAADPDEGDLKLWDTFCAEAAGADFTLGAVMRIDDNKRPLDWLEIAARFHAQHPASRFVIVGDGVLADEARALAARLGLRSRVLFTGRSRSVGYWMAKMDALLLTSRYEGTPNVLIEAQMAGVPVVTTPAGGAAETVQHGVTGFVLSSLASIDVDEASRILVAMANRPSAERESMRAAAIQWSKSRFSVDQMLTCMATIFTMDARKPLLAADGPAVPVGRV